MAAIPKKRPVKGELVSFMTKDRLNLQGFFVNSKHNLGIIYVHGLTGRIHPGDIFDAVTGLLDQGKVLLFDNRGFGNYNSFKITKRDKHRYYDAGGAFEKFTDCVLDIDAAVKFMKTRGCKKILLIGHSTGCQKTAYYLSKKPDKIVKGLVLLAPVNDTEAEVSRDGLREFEKRFKLAEKCVKSGKDDFLISGLSARRYYDLHKTTAVERNMFDYSKNMVAFKRIKIPILAVLGSKDNGVLKDQHEQRLLKLKKSANSKTSCDCLLIRDADHSFTGYYNTLVSALRNWIKNNLV